MARAWQELLQRDERQRRGEAPHRWRPSAFEEARGALPGRRVAEPPRRGAGVSTWAVPFRPGPATAARAARRAPAPCARPRRGRATGRAPPSPRSHSAAPARPAARTRLTEARARQPCGRRAGPSALALPPGSPRPIAAGEGRWFCPLAEGTGPTPARRSASSTVASMAFLCASCASLGTTPPHASCTPAWRGGERRRRGRRWRNSWEADGRASLQPEELGVGGVGGDEGVVTSGAHLRGEHLAQHRAIAAHLSAGGGGEGR